MLEPIQDSLERQVVEIFRAKVKKKYRDLVRPEARLQADLDMDSLGVLSTMLAAEEQLGIAIFPLPADVAEIRTVGDIAKLVKSIQEKPAAGR